MASMKEDLEVAVGRDDLDLVGVVLAISRIPYGRPSELTSRAVLDEGRGTCSTKHLLLRDVVAETWPSLAPRLFHRPYVVTPALARRRFGERVAASVPEEGLVDVHTFATLEVGSGAVRVDVTFPLEAWDGASHVPLACGPGEDVDAGPDVLASKAALVEAHCDPLVREPFIAALTSSGV